MPKTHLVLFLTFLMSLCCLSQVDPANKRHERFGRDGVKKLDEPHRTNHLFEKYDKNGDESLSLEEFSNLPRIERLDAEKRTKLFSFLDKNTNNKLEISEFSSVSRDRKHPVYNNFIRLDLNKDGVLNISELSAFPPFRRQGEDQIQKLIRRLDTNTDGVIDKTEAEQAKVPPHPAKFHFKKYDLDENGTLSFGEYSKMPFMEKIAEERKRKSFNKLDSNSDNQLSVEEIRVRPRNRKQ